MLGKLLKHEFRATGRTMLPIYGAVLILAALANLSIRFINVVDSTLLTILFGLIIVAFVIGIFVAAVMTLVMVIKRFYRNLLKDEGYLMHTLPVTVHEQVWAKLITASVWFLVTGLMIWLVSLLTVLIQTGTDLGEIFAGLPSMEEIRQALAELGVSMGELRLLIAELLLGGILGLLTTSLHFYAAMSLGHMFSKDKVLLSVVFFIVISFVFSLFSTGYGVLRGEMILRSADTMAGLIDGLRFARTLAGHGLIMELVQAVVLYVATTLSLKKGLNLA